MTPLVQNQGVVNLSVSDSEVHSNGLTDSAAIVTGPAEHFYATLDALPIRSREVATFSKSGTPIYRQRAGAFYAGVNFSPGDILGVDTRNEFASRIEVKALVSVTAHPRDSLGLGLGYRFGDLANTNGIDSWNVFAAWFKTTNDSNGLTTHSIRLGVGYTIGSPFTSSSSGGGSSNSGSSQSGSGNGKKGH